MINVFIDKLFNEPSDYYLVKMKDISNSTHTYPGDIYLVSFQLPKKLRNSKLDDITIKDYSELESISIEANICLTQRDYPPFQLGLNVCSIEMCKPLHDVNIWEFIECTRKGKVLNYWELSNLANNIIELSSQLTNKKEV